MRKYFLIFISVPVRKLVKWNFTNKKEVEIQILKEN